MDFGAFLGPGLYPVFLSDGQPGKTEPWGHLLCRAGRPSAWLSKFPPASGQSLYMRLDLAGYREDSEGSLIPSLDQTVPLFLCGEVAAFRPIPQKGLFLLRFDSLIRFWPD
jgi:hypothetical protein